MINNGIILSKNFRNDMYKSFIVFCVLFLVIGCADKNAFSKFNVSKEKEIALDNIRFAKIEDKGKIKGIISVIYLNRIFPKKYKQETFYISMYLKNEKLYDKMKIFLNEKESINITKLPPNNRYSYLTDIDNKWNNYFLVKFSQVDTKNLKLKFDFSDKLTTFLNFQKNL